MSSSCDRFTEREAMSSEDWRAHLAECQDCVRQQSVDRVLRVSLAGFSEPRPSLDLQTRVVAEAARRHHERLLGSPWQRHLMRAYWAIAMAVSYLIVTALPSPVGFDASGWLIAVTSVGLVALPVLVIRGLLATGLFELWFRTVE